MLSHDPPSVALINRQALPDVPAAQPPEQSEDLNRRKGFMSSVKGVSPASRRSKRRVCCKILLWKWRKWRRAKGRFWISKAKKQEKASCSISSCPDPSRQTQKGTFQKCHPQNLEKEIEPPPSVGCDAPGGSEERLDKENCLQKKCKPAVLSEPCTTTIPSPNGPVTDPNVGEGATNQNIPTTTVPSPRHGKQSSVQLCEPAGSSERRHTTKPLQAQSAESDAFGGIADVKLPKTRVPSQRDGGQKLCDLVGPSEKCTAITPLQDQATKRDTSGSITCTKMLSKTVSPQSQRQTDVSHKTLAKDIYDFLDDFCRIYGSFIPLQNSDVLRHLKRKFNTDFDERKDAVLSEVTRYQAAMVQKPISSFRVVYKKHTLTLDDLSTLADQNWLNDQVMNMYGELIMESSQHKVHFLNSFFHRQLVTKGYEGVKRWTKQVDLFSKSLLLVPIHLEVHWCLVTADTVKKRIYLYDSQGNMLQKVARNILKYLMTEAKERRQAAFQNGWTMSFTEKIPQQTNENDCGVFVLEYCRCLALAKPLHFSQSDIPGIRKRIYRELCDCKLCE